MNEAARVRWDDGRREPLAGSPREASDPLAELARLVGQDDPYGDVFRKASGTGEHEWEADAGASSDRDRHRAQAGRGAADPSQHVHQEDVAGGWGEHDPAYGDEHVYADDERYYAAEAVSHGDDAGIADHGAAVDGAGDAIADLWARGGDAAQGHAPRIESSYDPALSRPQAGGSARRPLLVLAAVLALTGGGLAASFLVKGNATASSASVNGSGAPTILAASGPIKVKQDDPSATAPEDKDAALLSKGAGAPAGAVRVVASGEQPVDLGQLPKPGDDSTAAQSGSPFPEAKKVKTFVVHPSGAPIYDDGQAAAERAGSVAPPAPTAATPVATGRGVSTPASPTIASLAADPSPPADAAPASPPPAPAGAPAPTKPKQKPVANGGAGGFGLQLAASPSEAEAHAAFAKLKKKYPTELGSLSPNVHQSETGGKPVYRLRVGGMSRESATALCSKLMAGGGSCFVVHD